MSDLSSSEMGLHVLERRGMVENPDLIQVVGAVSVSAISWLAKIIVEKIRAEKHVVVKVGKLEIKGLKGKDIEAVIDVLKHHAEEAKPPT